MRKPFLYNLTVGMILMLSPHSHGANFVVTTVAEITTALGKVAAGDTILVHAGTYAATSTISLGKSGTSAKKCCFMAYPGDQRPLFNFSGGSGKGFTLSGNYWYVKGIRVQAAGDNGMHITGDNNIVEYCDFFENGDSGCQLGGGATDNQVINCDSYYNIDAGEGNADGFSPKLDVGSGNFFKGCRSWQNSDDGYDGYLRPSDDVTTTYENCWCYKNGYRKDGSASLGNGNGFKMGGSDNKDLRHNAILTNCLSVANRVKGFDQNNNKGSMTLYNCTAFNNGINYKIDGTILADGKSLTLTNCLSAATGAVTLTGGIITTCGWSGGFTVSNADFVSVDPAAITSARKADGGLPDITFMHLASTSKLIDAGTIINGMTYSGLKPDLGCFESPYQSNMGPAYSRASHQAFGFEIESLNANGIMKAAFVSPGGDQGVIVFFDLSGKRVARVDAVPRNGGRGDVTIDRGAWGAGVYIGEYRSGNECISQTLVKR